jgi:tetratricopeptide (TPR) repeat protein
MIPTIDLPTNFAAALRSGRLASMADVTANTSFDRFARALARVSCGRLKEARADFSASIKDVGDAARLELAFLDTQVFGKAAEAEQVADEIARGFHVTSPLGARARHCLGLARSKLGCLHQARLSLLESLDAYRQVKCQPGEAQVRDTLGSVLADCGRLGDAVHQYSMSIAIKARIHDVEGLAISLGNLGRIQLRAGRFDAAVECFEADLELLDVDASNRTRARVLNDLARAKLASGMPREAIELLEKAIEIARVNGYFDVIWFVTKDLALAHIATGELDKADQFANQALNQMPANAESYLLAYMGLARGILLCERGISESVTLLTEARKRFADIPFIEGELEVLTALAKAHIRFGKGDLAEDLILQGLDLAKTSSFQRFVPELSKVLFDLGKRKSKDLVLALESSLGSIASRFAVLGRLGGGAYGEVFRVYDTTLDCECALKVIRLRQVYDAALRQRMITSLEREMQVGQRIKHPGIARVFDVGQLEGDAWFVLEDMIDGTPLDGLMRGGKGDIKQGLAIFSNVALALDTLHAAEIVHLDIKPANIIIRPDGSPVVIDFGVSRMAKHYDQSLGLVAGSAPYMSPEQAAGRTVDGRSDIYSLGIVAFEWFAGERPLAVRAGPPTDVARLIKTTPPLPLRRLRPDASEELEQVIAQAIAKDPRDRPQKAGDFANQLTALSKKLDGRVH